MKLLIVLLCPLITFCQRNCAGLVVDKITGKGIPYATVGLIRENKGISANEEGVFSINASLPKTDSLRISSVGYKTQVLPIAEWVNGSVVALEQQPSTLEKVVISTNRQKQFYILNDFGHCSWNWYHIGLQSIYQIAQRFEAPGQGMLLSELELCKDASECIFRVRIYDVDSASQGPSKDLADSIIEVRSKESHVRITLESYHIVIPSKSFFVAIEWLFIPFNEEYEKVKRNGEKFNWAYYKPAIRYVYNRKGIKKNVWQLGFNGKWWDWSGDQDHNFQITTKLK